MMQAFADNKSEVSSEEALRIFKGIDQDNSGTISFSEYMVAAMAKKSLNSEDKL
jgi:Ca2+-binding EF-hand superfamily protein